MRALRAVATFPQGISCLENWAAHIRKGKIPNIFLVGSYETIISWTLVKCISNFPIGDIHKPCGPIFDLLNIWSTWETELLTRLTPGRENPKYFFWLSFIKLIFLCTFRKLNFSNNNLLICDSFQGAADRVIFSRTRIQIFTNLYLFRDFSH